MAYINKNVSTMAMPSGMNRMGQFPLDMSSVYYNKAELEAYAASGAIAYVGQIVSLVDETNKKVTVYSIQNTDGLLKEVGTVPVGDDKSIEVVDGKISLKGIKDLVFERNVLDEEGQPTEEKEEVQYQALMTKNGLIWIEPSKTTVEGLASLIEALSGRVKAIEDALPGFKTTQEAYSAEGSTIKTITKVEQNENGEVSVTYENIAFPEDKDTTYSVKDGEKVLKLEGTEFSTELELKHENGKISLIGKNGIVISEFSDADFVADGVLQDVSYDAENDKLIFTWNIIESVEGDTIKYKTIEVNVKDLVDVYTAGAKLDLNDNVFSHETIDAPTKTAGTGREYITEVETDGYGHIVGYKTASETVVDTNTTYTLTDTTSSEIDNIQLTLTPSEGKAQVVNVEGYNKTKIDNLLNAKANSADVEATYATKEALKATDDVAKDAQSRVDIVEGKIDEITSVGGEPNVVEKIKVNGVTLEVEKDAEGKSTKSVNIEVPTKVSDLEDDKTYDSRINAAQSKAEEGVTKAGAAQAAAEAAQNKADVADGKADKNAEDIKTLQDADTTANGKIQALENTVNNEVSGVAANYAAVVKNAGDISALSATVGTHTTDIADLKTATGNNATEIAGLKSAVGNVYTKTEAEGKFVEKEDGKSLISTTEIERLSKVNNYDDTSIKALIQGNTDAITNITKTGGAIETAVAAEAAIARAAEKANADAIAAIYRVDGETKSGILATEIARVEGLVATEKSRAEGIEADHEERIAEMENFWKAADDPEGTIDKLAEIVSYIEKDKTGAIDMAADIQENTEAIAAINDEKTGILVKAKEYTDTEIAKLTDGTTGILAQAKAHSDANLVTAKGYSDANLATAKGYSDTNLVAAKKYSDDSIAALLVKNVDNKTLQLDENGVASVKAVSTDLLTQGENELIFCAGNASGYITK